MGVMTVGALVGAAIDKIAGGDDPAEGALIGGVTAETLKIVLPVVVTYAVGWAALRGLGELRGRLAGAVSA